jgi:hypothetical protein
VVDQSLCVFNTSMDPHLTLFILGSHKCSIIAPKETATWAPYGHTMNHIGSKLYLFGGIGKHVLEGKWEDCLLDDMTSLDLLEIDKHVVSWKVLEGQVKPGARSHHVSVTLRDSGRLIMCAPHQSI